MRPKAFRLGGLAVALAVLVALALPVLPTPVARADGWLQPPGWGDPGWGGPGWDPGFPWLPPGGGNPPGQQPPGQQPPGQQPPGGGSAHFDDGFPEAFQVPTSRETGRPVGGWGCDSSGRTDGGAVQRVPVLFVHGDTRDAHDWDAVRQYYLDQGYTLCETWALSYGYGSTQQLDTDNASYPTVQAFVANMLAYLKQYKNANVTRVDIVSHSLGGTVVRKWLKTSGDYGLVHSFVEIAGPNHGLGGCRKGTPGVCGEIAPGSQWLADLNAGGETPGGIRYMTIYDGTGQYDQFYPGNLKDSPALHGATNHPYNLEHGTRLDHAGLKDQTADLQLQWLQNNQT